MNSKARKPVETERSRICYEDTLSMNAKQKYTAEQLRIKPIQNPLPTLEDPLSELTGGSAADNMPKRLLRIALLGYRSHPFVGGQGIYLKYLSRALSRIGHQVDVYSGPPYPELDNNIRLIKVPSLDLYAQPSVLGAAKFKHLKSITDITEILSKLSGGFAEPYCFGRRVVKKIGLQKYDIIHDNQSLSFALIELQRKGFSVVSTLHHPIHRDREIAVKAVEKWGEKFLVKRWYSFLAMQQKVVSKLNHLVTVSETSRKDIQQFFKRDQDRTKVIFNGIDTKTFKPLDHIESIPFRLVTTSSSDQALKGLRFLLKAISQLRKVYPKIHLEVIGELKKDGHTEKLLKNLQLDSHVNFSSKLSTPQLVEKYNQAHAVICPSLYEGFGLPAAEAMSCGAVVISTNGGALPEVVGDAGIIVEKGSSESIALAIESIFLDATLEKNLRKKARERIEKLFCWDKVAKDLTHYYHEIILDKC